MGLSTKNNDHPKSKNAEAWAVAFGPDGKTLAVGAKGDDINGWNKESFKLWNVHDRKLLANLPAHKGTVMALAFSPDGKTLATGSYDSTILLWDVAGKSRRRTLKGHTGPVRAVAYRPYGNTIATGGNDKLIRLWNADSGQLRATLSGHTSQIRALHFHPTRPLLASVSLDRSLRIWHVNNRKLLRNIPLAFNSSAVAFHPNDKWVVSGREDGPLEIWDIDSGKPLQTLAGHYDDVRTIVFSPDGRTMASGCGKGVFRLWQATTGAELMAITTSDAESITQTIALDGVRTIDIESHTIQIDGIGSLGGELAFDIAGIPQYVFEGTPLSLSVTPPPSLNPDTTTYLWSAYGSNDQNLADLGPVATINYDPNQSHTLIEITVTDGIRTFTTREEVFVRPPNAAPVAVDDSATTTEDAAVSINVISNDTDQDTGDVLGLVPGSAVVVSMKRDSDGSTISAGTSALSQSGHVITFSPGSDFDFLPVGETATVVIDYTVADDNVVPKSDVGTRTLTITGVNDGPVAVNDTAVTDEDVAVTVDVLANDTDADDNAVLSLHSVANGSHGTTIITGGKVDYTPATGFEGADTFTYVVKDEHGATSTGTVNVTVRNLVDLSGRIFDDLDNDGVFDPADGDAGLGGVIVQLFNQSTGTRIGSDATTAPDGTYTFDANLEAGTYKIVTVPEADLLDGKETAGSLGGTVDNTQDSDVISNISVGAPGTTADGVDYQFADIRPSDVFGSVWRDFNDDGDINFAETAIGGVTLTATGTDDRGGSVSRTATTDSNGVYAFVDLRPGTYAITETQPTSFNDGKESLGTVTDLGVATAVGHQGIVDGIDKFSGVVLVPGSDGDYYGFTTSADGIAYSTFHVLSVLSSQEAIDLGLSPDAGGNVTIIDILKALDNKSTNGLLYDVDGDGVIDADELRLRGLANDLFSAIND